MLCNVVICMIDVSVPLYNRISHTVQVHVLSRKDVVPVLIHKDVVPVLIHKDVVASEAGNSRIFHITLQHDPIILFYKQRKQGLELLWLSKSK